MRSPHAFSRASPTVLRVPASRSRRAIRDSRSQPAQDIAAEKVWAAPRREFPGTRIGARTTIDGPCAKQLEPREQRDIARRAETLVEEELRRRENDRAVHVVLRLQSRLIADPYRPHAEVARSAATIRSGQFASPEMRYSGCKSAYAGPRDDVVDVVQVALHGARGAEAVQRLDDEVASRNQQ